jgi:hypothetical protein
LSYAAGWGNQSLLQALIDRGLDDVNEGDSVSNLTDSISWYIYDIIYYIIDGYNTTDGRSNQRSSRIISIIWC